MIILGIDPGSRLTGYGVITITHQTPSYLTSGHIQTQSTSHYERLGQIFTFLNQVITRYQPQQVAIEAIFMHRNANSALKLGQARGAAIAAISQHHLPLSEYSARVVKKAVVGYGAASKTQIQEMVKHLLNLSAPPQSDAADALAIALCHAFHHNSRYTTHHV